MKHVPRPRKLMPLHSGHFQSPGFMFTSVSSRPFGGRSLAGRASRQEKHSERNLKLSDWQTGQVQSPIPLVAFGESRLERPGSPLIVGVPAEVVAVFAADSSPAFSKEPLLPSCPGDLALLHRLQ